MRVLGVLNEEMNDFEYQISLDGISVVLQIPGPALQKGPQKRH